MWWWFRDGWVLPKKVQGFKGTDKYKGTGRNGYTKDGTGYQRKATKKKHKKRKKRSKK